MPTENEAGEVPTPDNEGESTAVEHAAAAPELGSAPPTDDKLPESAGEHPADLEPAPLPETVAGPDEEIVPSLEQEQAPEPSEPDAAKESASVPPVPPVIDVTDLDWEKIGSSLQPEALRARMRDTVERVEAVLDSERGSCLLFDDCRESRDDRALKIGELTDHPLWFIGDIHGDLLALDAALALIDSEARRENVENPRLVLLGDLFDDGGYGLETLLRVFELMLDRPRSICLIAGNHDEALGYNGARFTATVSPADFSDFLNENLAHEWIGRAGKLAVRIVAECPRALFFPDGLLAVHGGFPLVDLHESLARTGDFNDPRCLIDFVWTRAHPRAKKKLPNRTSRGSQFGHEDFAAFCALSETLGRRVTHMVRGHDHVDDRYEIYPAYSSTPVLTTVAMSRRLERELFGPHVRVPTVARWIRGSLPQVYRLHIPDELIVRCYPNEAGDLDSAEVPAEISS